MFEKFINSRYTMPALYVIIIFLLLIGKFYAQTPQQVYNACVEAEIQHPEIVTRQAILETGWFECESCSLRYNNIFGFWNGKEYLEFSHWKRSVYYYRSWVIRKGYSGGDYYEFLKKKWGAPDMDKYCNKLKAIEI